MYGVVVGVGNDDEGMRAGLPPSGVADDGRGQALAAEVGMGLHALEAGEPAVTE